MLKTEQTLDVAFGELQCIRPDEPATIDELQALNITLGSVDILLRECVDQRRVTHSWPDIAYALGTTPRAARLSFGGTPSITEQQVYEFWDSHAERFAWDFLPLAFLHPLYATWMRTHTPDLEPMPPKGFTRVLRSRIQESSPWTYTGLAWDVWRR